MKRRFVIMVLFLLVAVPPETYSWQKVPAATAQQPGTFSFVPETVYPLGMRSRQVTAEFILKVNPDTVLCYLPYFGQATSIDYGSRKSSTDFVSVKFDYTERKGKKGATIMSIQPKDNRAVRTIEITCYPGSEYANVSIIFNQQQSIAYRGRIVRTGATTK